MCTNEIIRFIRVFLLVETERQTYYRDELSVKLHHHLRLLHCVINYYAGDVFALQYFSAHQVMINEEEGVVGRILDRLQWNVSTGLQM